jgi:hypothetical protein
MHHLVERLRGNGIVVIFSGLKKQVIDVMKATGLYDTIGEKGFYATAERALEKHLFARRAPRCRRCLAPGSLPVPEQRFG